MEVLLIPPVAFVIYLVLVSVLARAGEALAGETKPANAAKTTAYASGEEAAASSGVPGYRPFIRTALFFAVLHLGVLVLASGSFSDGFSGAAVVYVIGLIAALLALILG